MNLEPLYEIQAKLKERIGYKKEDKFEKMMLAMMVEFMECANDWRGFKYWSTDQEAKQTLLEEYVDGLHFVLEAGLDLVEKEVLMALPKYIDPKEIKEDTKVVDVFKNIVWTTLQLDIAVTADTEFVDMQYMELFEEYLALGEMLGFTEQQIETAYLEKNKENHDRQNRGY